MQVFQFLFELLIVSGFISLVILNILLLSKNDQPLVELNIMVFSGGTGFREINMALARRAQNITRVVPVWDNGGSSKVLRECFHLIPVGDIRHALMTQAHGEGRLGAVVKLFNWRLSSTGDEYLLLQELNSFIEFQHPLIKSVEPRLANAIISYLKQFDALLPKTMDLHNGSIGNFVLVGAYLVHDKDINTAIEVFRQLCSIKGNVWPVALNNALHINAMLVDQQLIVGQENTTKLNRHSNTAKIAHIIFSNEHTDEQVNLLTHTSTQANPKVIEAIKKAKVIVYGPGSFFTSILPHIMVEQIADAIAQADVPKVFIGNLLEDNESYGYNLEQLIDIFLQTAGKYASNPYQPKQIISHILINKSHEISQHTINQRKYLLAGETIERFSEQGITLMVDDMESPWKRGGHDANWVADYIINC